MPTIGPPGYLLIVSPLGSSTPGSSMISVFHRPRNSIAVLLAADYLPDDGEMQVTAGYGENFGDIDEDNPQYIEVFRTEAINSATGLILDLSGRSVYEVTGRTDDVLTVVIADGYTDQAFSAGDKIYGFLQAEHIRELQDAINALEAGGAGSVVYTNATAMPEAVGGYDAGTTFDGVEFSDLMDGLLYPYQDPAFTSFSISGQATTVEVGTTISGDKTFIWGTSNPSNVESGSLTISDVTEGDILESGLSDDGTEVVAVGTITHDTATIHTWRITGEDTEGDTFQRDYSVSWRWKLYYGTSASAVLNEAGIEGLTGSLSAAPQGTYSFSAGGYKYFAWPDSFDGPADIKDAATGLRVAMAEPTHHASYSNLDGLFYYALVSVTNAQGVTSQYRLYRTANVLGGSIQIEVS